MAVILLIWHPTKYETIIPAQNGTMAVEFITKLPNDHKFGILCVVFVIFDDSVKDAMTPNRP